ncbi:phosphoglucomutase/phosphomannomutase family protein [Candidatus Aerophobetes bacterium]|nr:phosphoglucomutase/phosphomannomutase family protein [Candidatus Aerophobetes bacterium]
MEKIKFGTDGWRGVIADDFTFANVVKVAQAIADYYKTQPDREKGLVVGYDTRFLSFKFARAIAEVLIGNNLPVLLSQSDVPTQCISFTVKEEKLPGGVMITASHNPPEFNGIKIKGNFGGSATPKITNQIESFLNKSEIKKINWEKGIRRGLARKEDLLPPYLDKVKAFLDWDILATAQLKIIYDPMFGVGYGLIKRLLRESKCQVITIHPKYNPGFGGINPEPIEENLKDLKEKVLCEGADLGIATDGDADRLGLVDDKGRYLTPHQVFSLLLLYLVEERKMEGGVAKAVSLGYQPERIARKYRLPLDQTPVGFKYICDKMLTGKVFFGGEESGGYGYKEHLPERDGLLSSLLFVEMVTKKGKPLSYILNEMERKFGKSFFKRVDFQRRGIEKEEMVEKLSSSLPSSLGGVPLREVITIDGLKYIMEDESWLLIRPSGTEPKVRVYAEAPKKNQLDRIIQEGVRMAQSVDV